jgi:DNA mismatch endonuclease (patch repair protein)
MSKIRGKDTKIEVKVRKWLYHNGIRYRKNSPKIIGKPDISIKKYKIAIFINGCFWHGHECIGDKRPKTNTDFWSAKIQRNIARDKGIYDILGQEGWLVLQIWECTLKRKSFESKMFETLSLIEERRNYRCNQNRVLK